MYILILRKTLIDKLIFFQSPAKKSASSENNVFFQKIAGLFVKITAILLTTLCYTFHR